MPSNHNTPVTVFVNISLITPIGTVESSVE